MNFRKWNLKTDYEFLTKWWQQWDFGIVPIECLPPLGIMIEKEDKPICGGGLYIGQGTAFGFMEWVVRDKNISDRDSHKALKICIDELCKLAIDNECKLVYTVTGTEALQKRYVKYHNFELAENNTKTFVYDIENKYKDKEFIQDEIEFNKKISYK